MKLLLLTCLALVLTLSAGTSPSLAQIRAAPPLTATSPAVEAAEIARLQTKIAEQNKTLARLRSDYASYQDRLKVCVKRTTNQQCIDMHTARSVSGQPIECAPYTCNGVTGFCAKTCRSSEECYGGSCSNGVCR